MPEHSLDTLLQRPFVSMSELLRLHAARQPDAPALLQNGETLRYGELDALMDRIAASLQREGVRPQESIAICGANAIRYAALYMGAIRAGVTVAPLSPSTPPEGLVGMVEDAAARILFVDAAVADALKPVRGRLGLPFVTLDDDDGGRHFSDWLAPEGAAPEPVEIQPDWPLNIIYSSGTTGVPKGIVQPQSQRWGHVRRGIDRQYGPGSLALLSTPLYSNTTLLPFFQSLGLGGAVLLMAKFDAERFLQLAEQHRVTHATLVPVQYRRILAVPDFDRFDLSGFRVKFCTSSPFPADLKREVLARWPGELIDTYGMTEGGGVCQLEAHRFPDKLHTVGQPVPGHDIRIIDDGGRELPPGETGEVVGHSGAMMLGYHNQPEKTAEAEWYDPAGKRFIRTGDVGYFDQDGFLVIVDRKKDMIISGGFNIYPSDIEQVLRGHPDVAEATVVGVPSERWGETPVGFVVSREGAAPDADSIRDWANQRLGKTQRLAAVALTDRLPRNAIGKVLKRDLRDAWLAGGGSVS
ncbi:MAG: acyl--CoA ligase [Ectothiorhodospiraceae bacterium]|nr:acyl--CoA ligase [Ectothiorhodospiraceae bacterium]